MRRGVSRHADTEPIAMFLSDISDEVVGVVEKVGSRIRFDRIFFGSRRVSSEGQNVVNT
jgi:hypothetical protein